MKKHGRTIGIILLSIMLIWIIMVIVDCIRLGDIINNGNKKKPFITITTKEYTNEYEYKIEYIGLGYSVEYCRANNSLGYSTQVKLFYIVPINGFEVL